MANKAPLVLSDGVEQLQSTDSLIATEYVGIANFILTPTGTGAIQAGTGGNARGNYAVDLQLRRSADTQVASGNYSFLAGLNNTCSANYSAVVGGYSNVINAPSGTGACAIVGGFDNTVTQSAAVAMIGCRQSSNIGDSVNNSYYNGMVGCLNSALEYVRFSGAVGLQSCTMTGVSGTPINNCAMVGCNGCGITENGSSIVGGNTCTISGKNSSIVGGYGHTITSRYSFIAGGYSNQVNAQYGFVSGRENTIPASTGDYNTIGGGYSNTTVAASTYNGHNILAGGYDNSIQGQYCAIGGGYSNDITRAAGAQYATIAGGRDNTVTVSDATIGGGRQNTVTTTYATVPGGYYNKASGTASLASGFYAHASQYGQHSQAGGGFSANGDAQTSVLVARNQTTDGAVTELFLNGSTERLVIPEGSTWFVTVKVVGRQTNDDFTTYGLHWTGLLTRNSGGNATLTNNTTVSEYLNDFSWSCVISADTTNQSLKIEVQGGATDDVNWVARIELVETF